MDLKAILYFSFHFTQFNEVYMYHKIYTVLYYYKFKTNGCYNQIQAIILTIILGR